MTPLDVSTLGTIIGKLQNAASATAHGLHEDARDDAKRAGELLIGMLGWYVMTQLPIVRGSRGFGSSSGAKEPDPLVAAKERLGAWLSAEPCRSWDREGDAPDVTAELWDNAFTDLEPIAKGKGETMADAILAAIDKASGAA
jgi:hypothetical protein